ncbi:MAG TPA: STAS domain-containing protein [Mycobacterium sp.]|nr:STAS domain-containing protein [Mycobacterium sp.]
MTARNATFECGGAQIRSHTRHLATVVAVHGDINSDNVDTVSDRVRRFILTKDRLVFDVSDVKAIGSEALSMFRMIGEDCAAAAVDWAVVASLPVRNLLRGSEYEATVPLEGSVSSALHHFAEAIDTRRELLLPLVRKSA